MAKPNEHDGYCEVCRKPVPRGQGVKDPDPDARLGYRILCLEHARDGALDPPPPPEASKLPSIHMDEDRYER
jgi:hypothetical protein